MDRTKPVLMNTTAQMPEADIGVACSLDDLKTLREHAARCGVPLEAVISDGLELYAQILEKGRDPRVTATLVFERDDPCGAFDREIVPIYDAATVQ